MNNVATPKSDHLGWDVAATRVLHKVLPARGMLYAAIAVAATLSTTAMAKVPAFTGNARNFSEIANAATQETKSGLSLPPEVKMVSAPFRPTVVASGPKSSTEHNAG